MCFHGVCKVFVGAFYSCIHSQRHIHTQLQAFTDSAMLCHGSLSKVKYNKMKLLPSSSSSSLYPGTKIAINISHTRCLFFILLIFIWTWAIIGDCANRRGYEILIYPIFWTSRLMSPGQALHACYCAVAELFTFVSAGLQISIVSF